MLLFELDNYVSGNVVYNDMLNPKIYGDDGNMRPEVHKALMAVADNFINDIDHPDLVIHDIILTGSSANYNWTKFSDIDLHLISDVDVFADPHMAEKYFNAAKNVWNNNHDVTIRGLDVEVYVEDNDEHNESLGRYSVLNNEWISKPVHNRPVFDEDAVNRKVRYLMREIDAVVDGHPIDIEHIKKKIWDMRKAGLAKGGEFSVENLAFKVLRNMGYLDKIRKALDDAEDEELSIRENEEIVYKCGWCGNETDADGNPIGKPGRRVLGFTKKVNGKCCPGGSRDYQSQKSHEDDMRINEIDMPGTPESAIGKVVYINSGGVNYGGTIKKVKQINGQWYGFAKFLNDSNPDNPGFRVKLDPERFDQIIEDDMRLHEIKESFDSKQTWIELARPLAVKAVNLLNKDFEKWGVNERAIYHDKFTISIDGSVAGMAVDIVEKVLDELGGGEYFDYK